MKYSPFSIILVFFTCLSFSATAQISQVLDNTPHRIKWKRISTPQFEILFQDGFTKEAMRVANTLQYLAKPASQSLGVNTDRIAVILQNRQSISNGFVAVAPRRSEFFTMPPQDYNRVGTNHYLDHLAVHEYRHVVQYQRAKTGWTKALYKLFGEGAFGVMAGVTAPSWFWEGDAVTIETALTPAGRGRIPRFDMLYRTNLLERRHFNYHKQYLGSFKHQVPNWYVLGYHMVTHVRRHHDTHVWDRITKRAWSFPFVPFAFSNAMKKETGHYLQRTYRNMNSELGNLWRNKLTDTQLTDFEMLSKRNPTRFTDYEFPQYMNDGKILALRSGIADIQQFVSIDENGNEKIVFTPGIMNNSGMLSVAQNKVVWNEFHYHPRWRAINYSVIKTYDIDTGRQRTLTRKSRYSAAALSPDATKVVTVEVDELNKTSLVILDANTGSTIKRFLNPENFFYQMPRFSEDGSSIIVVKMGDKGKTLALYDVENGNETELIPYSHENIGHPVMFGNYVLYNSPYNGVDNIYALDLSTGKKYMITSSRFGAFNPSVSVSGDKMVYNDFTKDGLMTVQTKLEPDTWTPVEDVKDRNIYYYKPVVEQEGNINVLADVPQHDYPRIDNYPRIKGLLNVHSWGPYWMGSYTTLTAGIFSQDVLSTAILSSGINVNANERSGNIFANVSYQSFFPIIDVGARSGFRASLVTVDGTLTRYTWKEDALNAGLRVPLLLTHSRYHEGLNLSARTSLLNIRDVQEFYGQKPRREGFLNISSYSMSYYRLLKQSRRDLVSRWGQTGYVTFAHTPFGGMLTGNLIASEGTLYFPGLFKNHGIQILGGFQYETGDYAYLSPLLFPRGFLYEKNNYLTTASFNYWMPLLYPDLTLGPVFYLQRIKTNLFFDHATGYNPASTSYKFNYYNSLGVDLLFDYNLFRIRHVLLESGVRVAYHPDFNRVDFRFIIGSVGF